MGFRKTKTVRAVSADEEYSRMTGEPVQRLVCSLAVPTIVSNLVMTIYNMADAYFIGRISTSAAGAVGIALSAMAVTQGLGFLCGQGSGNNMSRLLGAHKEDEASKLAAVGFFTAAILGALYAVLALTHLEAYTRLLGSTDTILRYAMDYIGMILVGAPWMASSLVMNNQLRYQGQAFYAMIGLASGGVLNMFLDPLFIFTFGMGIKGAALATVLSQLVSFCILLHQVNTRAMVRIRFRNFRPTPARYGLIVNGGFPSLCRNMISGVSVAAMNTAAGVYGDAAIAAIAIVTKITQFSNSIVLGFGQAFQPVCGYNYGAERYDRVRESFWFCVKLGCAVLLLFGAVEWAFAPRIIEIFRKGDPLVTEIGALALRFQCLTLWMNSWCMISNMMEQVMGKAVRATLVGISRFGLFLIPAVAILPRWFGLRGIQLAQPAADICAFLMTCVIQGFILRELAGKEREMKEKQGV